MSRAVGVLLLVDSLNETAGTENQLLEIIQHVDREKVRLLVACLEDGERLQSIGAFATPLVFPAPGAFSLAGLRQMLRLRRALRRHSVDIVAPSHQGRCSAFAPGAAGRR
jgi:hypothetical protein